MNLITLDKISKSYSEKVLLDNVTLNITILFIIKF